MGPYLGFSVGPLICGDCLNLSIWAPFYAMPWWFAILGAIRQRGQAYIEAERKLREDRKAAPGPRGPDEAEHPGPLARIT